METTYLSRTNSRMEKHINKKKSIFNIDYWIKTDVVMEFANNLFVKWEKSKQIRKEKAIEEKSRKETYKPNFFSKVTNIIAFLFISFVICAVAFAIFLQYAYAS